jgi:hypothetical protein
VNNSACDPFATAERRVLNYYVAGQHAMGVAMHNHLAIILAIGALILGSTLAGCGADGVAEHAELASQPLASKQARLKIYREKAPLNGIAGARVVVDGKQIADMDNGGSTLLDVPAGKHQIVVDNWQHPNVYKLDLDVKPGMMYVMEITAREEAAVAGMFGLTGMLIEAAANENGGVWQIRVVEEKRIS